MAVIKRLSVGQILWQVKRVKCGNTKMSRGCLYPVEVKSIAEDGMSIMASWNGNPARRYRACDVAKLRVSKPEPKTTVFGMDSY